MWGWQDSAPKRTDKDTISRVEPSTSSMEKSAQLVNTVQKSRHASSRFSLQDMHGSQALRVGPQSPIPSSGTSPGNQFTRTKIRFPLTSSLLGYSDTLHPFLLEGPPLSHPLPQGHPVILPPQLLLGDPNIASPSLSSKLLLSHPYTVRMLISHPHLSRGPHYPTFLGWAFFGGI